MPDYSHFLSTLLCVYLFFELKQYSDIIEKCLMLNNTEYFMNVALWMVGGLVSLSLMAIGARELGGQITTFQILFFRSVISLIVITLIIVKSQKTSLIFK